MLSDETFEYPMEEGGPEVGEPRGKRSQSLSPTPPSPRGQGNRRRRNGNRGRGPPRRSGMGRTPTTWKRGLSPTSRGGANGNFSFSTRFACYTILSFYVLFLFNTDTRTLIYTAETATFRDYINNYI